MKARWCLLIGSVLSVSIPLSGQQPARTPATTPKGQPTRTQALKQRCDEFLEPLRGAPSATDTSKSAAAFNQREAALDKLESRFAKNSDEDLQDAEFRVIDCVTDLPDRRSRSDAFDAYILIVREQETRVRANDLAQSLEAENKEREQQEAELKKQRDNFLEAAKFATALYKENEQRKEQNAELVAVANDLLERYRAVYNLAHEAVDLAARMSGSSRLSLPAFVYTAPPQVIRIETPAVPRALHCMANTTGAPLLPQGTSTTWVNCW